MYYKLCLFGLLAVVYPISGASYPYAECGRRASHSLIKGHREDGDKLIYQTVVRNDGAVFTTPSEVFEFPPMNQNSQYIITRVDVNDKNTDGYGGCAFILEGGVDTNFVKIKITSAFMSYGYNFDIKIYGMPQMAWLVQQSAFGK